MIFKNINPVFPCFNFCILFSHFCHIQYALLNVLFWSFNFLNSFKCFSAACLYDRGGSFCRNMAIAKKYFTVLIKFKQLQPSVTFLYPLFYTTRSQTFSKMRNIFVNGWLKPSRIQVVLQLALVHTSPQLSWIKPSGLTLYLAL